MKKEIPIGMIKQYLGAKHMVVEDLLTVIGDLLNHRISIDEFKNEVRSFPACDDYYEGR